MHLVPTVAPAQLGKLQESYWWPSSPWLRTTSSLIPGMIAELPTYLSLAAVTPAGLVFDHSDLGVYTADILSWWRINSPSISAWAMAARIIFSLQISSAASERVFSLVENL